jgi:4-carboxymuconolactone decarboxylase
VSTASERIPAPDEGTWTGEQRRAAERVMSGPRGALIGPFRPLLHSPELMDRIQQVGEHIRWGCDLPDEIREMAILMVARRWDQEFEWRYHLPIALNCGLTEADAESLGRGERPEGMRPQSAVAWQLLDEVLTTGAAREVTIGSALDLLGTRQVVELVATAGYYTTLAYVMNVAGTQPPEGAPMPRTESAR